MARPDFKLIRARGPGMYLQDNIWDRQCMMLRAYYKLTPASLNRVFLSLEVFGRAFTAETTTLQPDHEEA